MRDRLTFDTLNNFVDSVYSKNIDEKEYNKSMKAINIILTNAQKLGNENDKKIVDLLEKVANLLKRVKGLS